METKLHPKPYPLGWVCDNTHLQVTKQCRLRFAITFGFVDEVYLDVVPLDICGIVLGSPYLYDMKAIFYREDNMYKLTKYGIEYIVHAHRMKTSISLVSASQMKMLVNASKNFVLMIVKEKGVEQAKSFKGCDTKIKKELIKVVSNYDIMFQEPKGLPPKMEIQHEIHLQQDAPIPNIGMYRYSIIENAVINKKIQELLEREDIRPRSSSCGSPIVLVPKKYGT